MHIKSFISNYWSKFQTYLENRRQKKNFKKILHGISLNDISNNDHKPLTPKERARIEKISNDAFQQVINDSKKDE